MNEDDFMRYTRADAELMHSMFVEFARIEREKRRARIIRAAIVAVAILVAMFIAWRLS
jgi:hypothetical protein